jgi:protein dithiol oxidoreductase (disulfide-forming)
MAIFKSVLAALAALLLALAAAGVHAQQQNMPQLSREYIRLDPPHPVATGEKIEIIEFFYYGCPICYELQPTLSRWLFRAPDFIAIRRVPALSTDNWENFAKLFYSLEVIGDLPRLHWPIYDNFHFDGVKLNEEAVMADWVSRNGVNREKFTATYRSPEVMAKVNTAREMIKNYEVKGVPSIVVDGKYLTSARMAGGTKEMMKVVDQLVIQARKDRTK